MNTQINWMICDQDVRKKQVNQQTGADEDGPIEDVNSKPKSWTRSACQLALRKLHHFNVYKEHIPALPNCQYFAHVRVRSLPYNEFLCGEA